MAKKLISISLTLIFLFSAFGFALNRHYCHGKLKEVSIEFSQIDESCCDKPEGMPENCCHDEEQIMQLDEDYLKSATIVPAQNVPVKIAVLFIPEFLTFRDVQKQKFTFSRQKYPPPMYEDILVRVQSFLL